MAPTEDEIMSCKNVLTRCLTNGCFIPDDPDELTVETPTDIRKGLGYHKIVRIAEDVYKVWHSTTGEWIVFVMFHLQ